MITVKRLPRDPGPAAWNALLPSLGPARQLDEVRTADWLIIGAGWAGLAAARRLLQLRPHDRIALLEASRVGEGPAGRNSGFMIDLPHNLDSDDYNGAVARDRQQITMNRAAIAFAAEAAEELGMSAEAFSRTGKVNAAGTEKGSLQLRSYASHVGHLNEPFERLDAAVMRALTGTTFYREGVFTPGTAMVQPAMFIRRMAEAAIAAGLDLYEQSPVTALERVGQDWCATTPGGRVTAPRVILAVNGHAESFGFFERRLMPVFTYASMTRALDADEIGRLGGEPRFGILPADPMGSTVRRVSGTGGDRIVIRSRFTYAPSMVVSDDRLEKMAISHERSFSARFPMLDGVEMQYRWGGRLCLSRNGVPAFGEVEDNLFAACCQNGLGTTKGTLSGMLVAELACAIDNPMIADMQAFEPPNRLPPGPFAKLGANALIKWKEHKAGKEL